MPTKKPLKGYFYVMSKFLEMTINDGNKEHYPVVKKYLDIIRILLMSIGTYF